MLVATLGNLLTLLKTIQTEALSSQIRDKAQGTLESLLSLY
jgi:hypothetical protein